MKHENGSIERHLGDINRSAVPGNATTVTILMPILESSEKLKDINNIITISYQKKAEKGEQKSQDFAGR